MKGSGTQNDPFIPENPTDVREGIYNNDSSYFLFDQDIDMAGGEVWRTDFSGEIDFNGYSVLNIGNFSTSTININCWFSIVTGTIKNGRIDVNIDAYSGSSNMAIFDDLDSGGLLENLKLTGSITHNGTGNVNGAVNILSSGSVTRNIITEIDLSGNAEICGFYGSSNDPQNWDIDNCVAINNVTNQGSASIFGFENAGLGGGFNNCFWDSDVNSAATDNGNAVAKTTSQLQTLSEYTSITDPFDMVDISNHDGQQSTAIWAIDDGVAYPVMYFEVEATEVTISGTVLLDGSPLENCEVAIFSADDLTALTNMTFVEVTQTDVNGDYAMAASHDSNKYYIVFPLHGVVEYSGTAESGTVNTLTDNEAGFSSGEFDNVEAIIRITSGTGSGQVREIASNTDTEVTVTEDWSTQPDATSDYEIELVYTEKPNIHLPTA